MPFLQVDGRKTFYNQLTPEGGQPGLHFIFIHGLGSSNSFWEPVQKHLAKIGHASVAFDSQGSGLSEIGAGNPVSINSIARDAKDIMSQLNMPEEKTIAVGHSMGGIVVAELAQLCNLHGVVMVGPVLPQEALGGVFNARIETVSKDGMEAMAKVIPSAATGSKASSVAQAFIRTLLLSQSSEGYIGLCRAIANSQRPAYEKCKSPLLVIAGQEDRTAPTASCQTIFDTWGSEASVKRMDILTGVGHWHSIESPEGVSGSIEAFLTGPLQTSA
ncbi:hypothetical protein NLU13_4770 [Sarocladium strictum]|uniref:Serine aminopeptidase S33 domain-containing protein n=1 Tax=Sarocladium strictum TaxID=5046 RepID=A0AA39GM43_SARSR|nr:hypothetical protein NLU13_4770 [Sarocladium strictum]